MVKVVLVLLPGHHPSSDTDELALGKVLTLLVYSVAKSCSAGEVFSQRSQLWFMFVTHSIIFPNEPTLWDGKHLLVSRVRGIWLATIAKNWGLNMPPCKGMVFNKVSKII